MVKKDFKHEKYKFKIRKFLIMLTFSVNSDVDIINLVVVCDSINEYEKQFITAEGSTQQRYCGDVENKIRCWGGTLGYPRVQCFFLEKPVVRLEESKVF